MKKTREYEINNEFLKKYSEASILNAESILSDAKILLKNKSFARAYFLGVSAIEEAGKAFLAFSTRGRNLSNEGLNKKTKELFEQHSRKINSAFNCWITKSQNKREAIQTAVDLMIHLIHGREKAMYIDANPDNTLSIPMDIVRPSAATDCLKVAENCIHHTKEHIVKNEPPKFNSFDDKAFCLKNEKIFEIYSKEDFWEYLLSQLESKGKDVDYSKILVTYHDKYFSRNIEFKS